MRYLIISIIAVMLFATEVSALSRSNSGGLATTKAEAIRQAQQKMPGRVLKVEQLRDVYRVKLLQPSGRVVFVEIKRGQKKPKKGKN